MSPGSTTGGGRIDEAQLQSVTHRGEVDGVIKAVIHLIDRAFICGQEKVVLGPGESHIGQTAFVVQKGLSGLGTQTHGSLGDRLQAWGVKLPEGEADLLLDLDEIAGR